ncbi:MAG: hypothetical protein IKW01_05225 [Firmicutes bacterium]|nr:hypothetical protein [Bacillota bacterium]
MNCSDLTPSGRTENLVFLNKVFYDNTGTSCPVIYPLTTDTANFTQQLTIGSAGGCESCRRSFGSGVGCCSCGCTGSCDFDLCNAQFTVTNSCVTITSAVLSEEAVFTADDITIDGIPVTALTIENGRYFADLSGILSNITRCPGAPADKRICEGVNSCSECISQCENNGHFFLAEVPGPWEFLFNITIDGYVSNGRCTRDFRLCLKTRTDATGQFPIVVEANNNFALNCVDIPCQSQGIAPSLRFNFEACGMLLNPILTIAPAETPANGCPAPTELILTSSLVITPSINLQVVRPSLFALNACEVDSCCDNLGQCDDCAPERGCPGTNSFHF